MPARHNPPLVAPTLQQIGYDSGDFFPIYTFSTRSLAINAFTQADWINGYETNEFQLTADKLPENLHYTVEYRANAHGDQLDVRLRNSTDAETLPNSTASFTGSSWLNYGTDPTQYTPTTTSEPVSIQPQVKNNDGTTEVELSIAQVIIGVMIP